MCKLSGRFLYPGEYKSTRLLVFYFCVHVVKIVERFRRFLTVKLKYSPNINREVFLFVSQVLARFFGREKPAPVFTIASEGGEYKEPVAASASSESEGSTKSQSLHSLPPLQPERKGSTKTQSLFPL